MFYLKHLLKTPDRGQAFLLRPNLIRSSIDAKSNLKSELDYNAAGTFGASFDGCFCSGSQYVVYYDGCSMRDFRVRDWKLL